MFIWRIRSTSLRCLIKTITDIWNTCVSWKNLFFFNLTLREKCPYMEFFLVLIFPYSDQKKSVFGHFSCSVNLLKCMIMLLTVWCLTSKQEIFLTFVTFFIFFSSSFLTPYSILLRETSLDEDSNTQILSEATE